MDTPETFFGLPVPPTRRKSPFLPGRMPPAYDDGQSKRACRTIPFERMGEEITLPSLRWLESSCTHSGGYAPKVLGKLRPFVRCARLGSRLY
jgi:hypothetical protein